MDYLYEKADSYIYDDNFQEAIPLFKQSLFKGNFESAFRLGTIYLDCFEELGLHEPDYLTAIQYLQIGAMNNHKACQKELGLLLLKKSEYKNYLIAIKWILSSGNYETKNDLETVIKTITKIYKNTNREKSDCLKVTIEYFNEYIKLTRNKTILTLIYNYRNELIICCGKNIIKNSQNITELESCFSYFKNYFKSDFFNEVLSYYKDKKTHLFLETCDDVKKVEQYLSSLNEKIIISSNSYLNQIFLWLARSYCNGEHNASVDFDLAIKYYKKINNFELSYELEKLIIQQCNELIKSKNYSSAKKYLKYIKSNNEVIAIEKTIKNLEEKDYFEKVLNKANTSEIKSKIELANLYEKGIGTIKNFNKALQIHVELYNNHKNKESFDFLFNHYNKNNNKELINLLKSAKKNNIKFNYLQENVYKLSVNSYATNNYEFVNAISKKTLESNGNIIYYLFDYYKKDWINLFPNDQFINDNFYSFMAIKKRNYSPYKNRLNFPGTLYNLFKLLNNEWIICTAPGHEKTDNLSNGVSDIVNLINLKNNFTFRNTLIQRMYTIEKKATSSSKRNNDYRVDMESIKIEDKINIEGKNIIVIDDITTTGSTLIACKNILMDEGAKQVILIALGKTKEL